MSFFSNLFGGANNGLVNGAQAREAVSHGAILLDVRTPMEHEAGTIPGSKNIAVQELAQRLGELDPNQSYVVYCRSGGRSAAAAALLKQNGFVNVVDLGGIGNW
ncbi:MAG: rhodanese-like domain-containing protein [Deltaproteobacteria bacterium]|nr:rhodanese-like domain-containing protein [Deltaproteobacteria bacterium]MBK9369039.1 rhodanese-like domain-containing protein [Deltaproteobacteria bacterium]